MLLSWVGGGRLRFLGWRGPIISWVGEKGIKLPERILLPILRRGNLVAHVEEGESCCPGWGGGLCCPGWGGGILVAQVGKGIKSRSLGRENQDA